MARAMAVLAFALALGFIVMAAYGEKGHLPSSSGSSTQAGPTGPGGPGIVAQVNGEPVTLQEVLDRKAVLEGTALRADASSRAVTLSEAFRRVVEAKVLVAEAKRRGITVTPEEVPALVRQQQEAARSAPPEARRRFEEELRRRGRTEDQF